MRIDLNIGRKYVLAFTLLSIYVPAVAQLNPFNYKIQKQLTCSNGAVVSAHALASDAGLQMLKKGGNAFDAAVATQLALAVVYPGAGNLGGGGFLVAYTADRQTIAIDYRETAPAKASRDMFLNKNREVDRALISNSNLSAGVPGTVAGIFETLPYCKLGIKTLIAPAISLAQNGFVLTQIQADDLNSSRDEFIQFNTSSVPFVAKAPFKTGAILKQPALAATLTRIRDLGRKGFYEGRTAALIVSQMQRDGGIISAEDLKNYRAKKREAMRFNYNGYEVITMPLPSSGGIILRQMLTIAEMYKLGSLPFHSAASVALIVEASRVAYADRANFLGDPDFVKVPVGLITSENYLRDRMSDYVPGRARESIYVEGIGKESEQTTHLSVIDKEGNVVSVTTTLNDHFGSKIVVRGAGFLLNNEMDDFSAKPGSPNMYGAIGNEKNAIAPNKRMLSSMTPTIVLRNGEPYIVTGTPGGTTIPTSVFETLVNLIDYKQSPADAVNNPKFHHQWLPDSVFHEKAFPFAALDSLRIMGYQSRQRGNIGRVELIVTERAAHPLNMRKIRVVADGRGEDDARGY